MTRIIAKWEAATSHLCPFASLSSDLTGDMGLHFDGEMSLPFGAPSSISFGYTVGGRSPHLIVIPADPPISASIQLALDALTEKVKVINVRS